MCYNNNKIIPMIIIGGMHMVGTVTQVVREIGSGYTNPHLASIHNHDLDYFNAVIKTKENTEGCIVLINELVSYELAKSVGLLMPVSGIAKIDEKTTFDNCKLTNKSIGHCFYSTYIKSTPLMSDANLYKINNKNIFEEIMLFDHIIYNKDRHRANVLVSSKKNNISLHAIDHSNVFKNQAVWDKQCFIDGIQNNDYLDTDILECNQLVYNMFIGIKGITVNSLRDTSKLFQEKITPQLIDTILSDIPSDWAPLSYDLRELKQYLLYRVDHLDDICEMIGDNIL